MKTITSAFGLTFHSSNQKPGRAFEDRECVIFNPCDGFHIAIAEFWEDGDFHCFRPFAGEPFSDDFYTAWAVLPETSDLDKAFPRPGDIQ